MGRIRQSVLLLVLTQPGASSPIAGLRDALRSLIITNAARHFYYAPSLPDAMTKQFELEQVEVSSTPLERFEEFLQSRGKRMTKQRRSIIDEVYRQHEHFDADELHDLLQRGGDRKVSRPTVYRTLTELVDAGLLRPMPLDGRTVYEHDYGYPQHDHLYCQNCKQLIEFQSDKLHEICNSVAQENNFRPSHHRLIIFGVCEECSKPKRGRGRMDLI